MLCFYWSLSQWSWQRKTEPTKSLGRGRHCVWQTDGSIEMLRMSQLGETTLIPVPVGLSLCLTDLPGRSKWIPEARVLDSTGSFSILILQKKCLLLAFDSVSSRSVMTLVPSPRGAKGHHIRLPVSSQRQTFWSVSLSQCFYHKKCGVNFSGSSQVRLRLHSVCKKSVSRGCVLSQSPGRYKSLLEREKFQYGFKFASQAPGLPHHPVQILFIRNRRERLQNESPPLFMWSNCLRKSGFSLTLPLHFSAGFMMSQC